MNDAESDQDWIDPHLIRGFRDCYLQYVDDVLQHHREGNPFAVNDAGCILERIAQLSQKLGEPVSIPAEFAVLCGQALTDTLPKRKGPRVSFDGKHSWLSREMARKLYLDRRGAGEKRDDILRDFMSEWGISYATADSWVRGVTVAKRGK
mgnify:CR=1 FL=1